MDQKIKNEVFARSIASKQVIDISWQNLDVFVGQAKPKSNSKLIINPTDDSNTGKSDTTQACDDLNTNQTKLVFKQVLKDQNGYAAHGETLAIMGPSGAGKTTLLGILTQKFKQSQTKIITGQCLSNGEPYNNSDFTSFGVFVMQNDLLFPCLTVRETILFSARLRLRGSEKLKEEKVDKLIKDLQLTHCQDTFIGSALVKGISGGERKRACIGVELVTDPIVVILDEPTSGLDSFTAYTLMNILKDLAKNENKCIIFSIHTPSYDIFNLIDRILLLQNGQTIYQGQTKKIIPYIQSLGIEVPQDQNVCDFFMYEITLTKDTELNYQNFEEFQKNKVQKQLTNTVILGNGFFKRATKNSFWYQFKVLVMRTYKNYIRNPQLLRSRVFLTTFFAIFYSYLYWGIGKDQPSNPTTDVNGLNRYIGNIEGALFNIGANVFFASFGAVIGIFPKERTIFLKEENSKTYSIYAYFLAKVLVEFQFILTLPIISGTVYYLAFQFVFQITEYVKFILICICISLCGNGLGIMTGSMFPDAAKATALATLAITPLQLFGGRFSNFGTMNRFFSWIQYLSPFKYYFEGFVRAFFDDREFKISTPEGLKIVDPISDQNFNLSYWKCVEIMVGLGLLFHLLAIIFLKSLIRKLDA